LENRVPALADMDDTFIAPIPLQDQILIQRLLPVTHVGKIELPQSARTKPKKGVVISVGPGRILENGKRSPMELQPDDVVSFSPYAGLNLEEVAREDGFMVMNHDDVLTRDPRPGEDIRRVPRKRS
jgi:chaperonin GroES